MNDRRPTVAASERSRKWGAEPDPMDADPLDVRYWPAYQAGFEHGLATGRVDSPDLRRVLALVMVVACRAFAIGRALG